MLGVDGCAPRLRSCETLEVHTQRLAAHARDVWRPACTPGDMTFECQDCDSGDQLTHACTDCSLLLCDGCCTHHQECKDAYLP